MQETRARNIGHRVCVFAVVTWSLASASCFGWRRGRDGWGRDLVAIVGVLMQKDSELSMRVLTWVGRSEANGTCIAWLSYREESGSALDDDVELLPTFKIRGGSIRKDIMM
ncbi:uncharacterized protein LY89DRAFT_113785 [Mollisia scopiformis]|uniref:Uncharacterized protein n=1 Tax=Mollisia scopiformis TaxID=149040 RepID=A0A194X5L0_MOLSC|nr:uncharacterized protein LY89DRAFT_113785 [Mollisia scopiformis]KUJ15468.1 hypothetical protein LY89DRAFT_113785 [Mollisia scopiformis]